MDEATRDKLIRLQELHGQRTQVQQEEEALTADLAASSVRGVRTALAGILGISVEALRLRYGAVKSATDVLQEDAPKAD